jgi:hypothetical protein
MHHTCCSHFPSRKDHLQTPLNSSHTTAILKQNEKKPPQPPLEKKVPKEFLISLSLSLSAKKKEIQEKFSPSLSRFSHQFSYLLLRISSLSDHTVGFSSFGKSCTRARRRGLRTRAPTSCTPPPNATKHGMDDEGRRGDPNVHTLTYVP